MFKLSFKFLWLSVLCLLMTACTSSIWDRTPPYRPSTVGSISGAVGGAIVGGAASGGIAMPLGAAIGGMWGGAVGHIIESNQTLVQELLYAGVQIVRVGDDIRIILPSDRFFKKDSANLNPAYQATLSKVIIFIRAFQKVEVKVSAYTDNTGSWQRNLSLSQLQAKVIAYYLWRGNIDARILLAKGYGEKYPISDNSTYEGQAQNRRVEITFFKLEPEIMV